MQLQLSEMIYHWVKTQDWESGVKIYQEHGTNTALKTLFKCPKNSFSQKKLKEELLKIAEVSKEKVAQTPQHQERKVPLEISELEVRRKLIYKKMADDRARLTVAMPDVERKKIAFSVLEAQKQVKDLWYQLDFYQKHGSLPGRAAADEIQKKPTEWLIKRVLTLRTYLAPGRYKDPEKESTKEKIERYREELLSIENELKNR